MGNLDSGPAGCTKAGTDYSGVNPCQKMTDYPQPLPPQGPDTEEGDEIQGIVDNVKIRKQATLKASKKAFFNEQGHKRKEPQLSRHRSALPSPPNTQRNQEGKKLRRLKHRKSIPREKSQPKPKIRGTKRLTQGQEQRKTR